MHIKYPDWPLDGPAIKAAPWVHAIAIIDGMVHDSNTTTKISLLWLKSTNQPNHKKGYMHSIFKVWRIYRCNQHGTGCNGGCDDVVADDDVVVVDAVAAAVDATTLSLPTPKKKRKRTRGEGKQNINTPIDDISNSKSIIIKPYNHSLVETGKLQCEDLAIAKTSNDDNDVAANVAVAVADNVDAVATPADADDDDDDDVDDKVAPSPPVIKKEKTKKSWRCRHIIS